MSALANFFRGRRVLVTGATGFKGSWLCIWLKRLGADVIGLADSVLTEPALFNLANIEQQIEMIWADVRDQDAVLKAFEQTKPEMVLHLAAQSLVRLSIEDPSSTFHVNVGGTVNVLEAIRRSPQVQAGVMITSDKCYKNVEWVYGYRETDELGGHDPYSGSKAAAEMAIHSYCRTFFREGTVIAAARAGNVIGGGDWSPDRIVPDCVKAWGDGQKPLLRNPIATRPWQHVLEPLSGYLTLARALVERPEKFRSENFNFGPHADQDRTVRELVVELTKVWDGCAWDENKVDEDQDEARLLKLCCDKGAAMLSWSATLDFDKTCQLTASWYKQYYEGRKDIATLTEEQIGFYEDMAAQRGQSWIA